MFGVFLDVTGRKQAEEGNELLAGEMGNAVAGTSGPIISYKRLITGDFAMATTKKGRAQDRSLVAAGQNHEVRYEAEKKGVTKDAVKAAVKKVGNTRTKVDADLEKR